MNVSHTPSSISLTVVARNRPARRFLRPARSRRASRSSIWPRPRPRSHHSAPTTWQVSTPSCGRLPVGVEHVRDAELGRRADAGVLEPGDPQRVQVRLGREQPGPQFGRAGRRNVLRDQPHGPVVQRAGGPAGRVALDPPVGRVRRARVDPGSLQGGGVDPGAVMVAVRQEGGPPAGDRVQVRRGRQAAGERGHGPAAAEHPGVRAQPGAVRGHRGQGVLPGPQPHQVAAQALQPARHRVHVRVAERGHRQPPAQLDHPGTRPGDLPDLLVRADGLDQAAAHGQGLDEPGRVRRQSVSSRR